MMLTTKGRYAVMALVDMAGQNRFLGQNKAISLADIAARQDITVAYLEQIFCKLKNAGVVKSIRGPGGGYVLAKDAADTSISEIISAVEEQIKMVRCGTHGAAEGKKAGCMGEKGKCATHDLWDGLGRQIENYLNAVTLEDVISNKLSRSEDKDLRENTRINHA